MKLHAAMLFAAVALLGTWAWAQEAPRSELTLDYSFARYSPSASYTKGHSFNGGGGQIKFNIGQYFGIMADFQGYNSNTTKFTIPVSPKFPHGANGTVSGNLFTYLFGPVVKFHAVPHVNPFFDVLAGAAHSNVYGNAYNVICQPVAGACATKQTPDSNGFALSAGGGLDIPINSRVDFRVGQFDYLYTRFTNIFNDAGQNNFRYITGLNIKMGMPSLRLPALACAAEPSEVLPWGGPVRATATATDFNPKHAISYSWDSNGGKPTAQGPSATVDTTSLAPGQYTLRADATDPRQKTNNTATCTASFTVKQPRPPVVACSASPATVKPGEQIAITVSGSSPEQSAIDKRSFSASAGFVKEGQTEQGNAPGEFTTVATLDTSNATPGPISINVGVTDVHGLSATCTASAEVVAAPAPPPPTPTAQSVGKCNFNDARRPTRIDNECKATLDAVALQLKSDPGNRLVIVGYADDTDTLRSAESLRAANVRTYLTKGDGKQQIDSSRVEIRKATDRSSGKIAQIYLVPPDAVVQLDNTDVVDENTLPTKPTGQ